MHVNKVDHVCVAVRDLAAARTTWEKILSKTGPDSGYQDDDAKVRAVTYMVGEVGIELMEDTTGDGPTAKFIEARGEGIMHIALNVPSTSEALQDLRSSDIRTIAGPDGEALVSPAGVNYVFVHPKAANGVTVEVLDTR